MEKIKAQLLFPKSPKGLFATIGVILGVITFTAWRLFSRQKKEPLYIGKSINLKSRLRQHYEGFLAKSSAVHFVPKPKHCS